MNQASATARATSARPTVSSSALSFNGHSIWAMYRFQMVRFFRTIGESLATPVITTALYFVVFGSAIGSRMEPVVEGLSYGTFLVPGLIMLSIFTNSIFNASFGIYFPKFTGTIYELLSAPISYLEIVIAFVGAAATKSVILGLVILPFFVTSLIRTIAWKTILADEGWVVSALGSVGLLPDEGRLLSTSWAVIGGLTYNWIIFMILPLYVSLEKIDPRLLAQNLTHRV